MEFFQVGFTELNWQIAVMLLIGVALLYFGIARNMEPLLLVPIGCAVILVNLPLGGVMETMAPNAQGIIQHYPYYFLGEGVEPEGLIAQIFYFGLSKEIIAEFGPRIPVLGVCLGHQCIGEVYGGRVDRAPYVMHGKTSQVYHDRRGVFAGLPSPMEAARYHSLAILEEGFPACLEVSAHTEDGMIMGVRHREYPVEGIQFHPESFMTPEGLFLLRNFLEVCR